MYEALVVCFGMVVVLCLIGSFFITKRKSRLNRYRQYIIRKIITASENDFRERRDFTWRWRVYNSVSYNRMLFMFWIRPGDFYPDKSFIDQKAMPRHRDNG